MQFVSKTTLYKITAIVCLLAMSACGTIIPGDKKIPTDAQSALVNADEVTAYSLQPEVKSQGKDSLHGYKVLGSIKLAGQDAVEFKREYTDALQEYLDESRAGHDSAFPCDFQPHHALRISTDDHHTYDYLVCFTCGKIEVFKDDAHYWDGQVRGTAVKLNEMFKTVHVPVAEPH